MVVIDSPWCATASVRHALIRRPCTRTVHAPQCPRSQPFLVPVGCRRSRRASSRVVRASTVSRRSAPLMTRTISSSRRGISFVTLIAASVTPGVYALQAPRPAPSARGCNNEALKGVAMPRYIKVAAAQMGPNNEGTPREAIVERMMVLLAGAAREGVELIVYPEMALTTYFPKKIRKDFDQFFETEVPPKALEPLLRRAAQATIAVHVGFCEKADGQYFNYALLPDRDGRLRGTFRKIHLPGTKAPDGFAQVYEPYYFAHGDTGYRVWDAAGARVGVAICQDRRYPESYRCLALQGAEIILIGYNTPISALALDLNELCMRSGAYANLCFVVGVAKAGVEDGVELIGGSCIINPLGQVLAKAATTGDELIVARIDLEQIAPVRKRWNFLGRRQPQHYGRLLMPVTEKETHR